jgi:hypothetical protein
MVSATNAPIANEANDGSDLRFCIFNAPFKSS